MSRATPSQAGREPVLPFSVCRLAAIALLLIGCATPNKYTPPPDAASEDNPDGPMTADVALQVRNDAPPSPDQAPGVDAPITVTPDTGAPSDGPCGAADDPRNCGTCGHDCTTLPHVRPGASVQCQAGTCVIPSPSCADGYGHCTANADDGCETNLRSTDRANCGACNFACPGAQPCVNGGCVGDCVQNTKRCSPAGDAVQTCNGQGAWMNSATCPLGCDPATKACVTCLPKTEDCSNGQDDDCDGKADCADSDCGNGKTCGTDKVCNNGACAGCKAGIACPTDVCKVTECSTGTQQCVPTSSTNGTMCAATTCNVGTKKVYKCSSGACAETRTTCDGNCNAGGTDCQPCGGQNQECCQGKCNGGLGCLDFLCKPCGQSGQPCCPVNSCANSTTLVCSYNDGYIRNGMPVHDPKATCMHCGGMYEVCCPGYACNSGLTCAETFGVYCVPNGQCGAKDSSCCIGPNGHACNTGLTCDNVQYSPVCH